MKQRNYGSGSGRLSVEGTWSRLQSYRDKLARSENPAERFLAQALSLAAKLTNILRNRRFRSEVATRLMKRAQHLQGSTFTFENRYPKLFAACRVLLADVSEPRILSFGCSTGEEVRSLEAVLPNAVLVGADINSWCIKECNRQNRSRRCTFVQPDSKDFEQLAQLDAIFCLAVFQRTEHRTAGKSPVESGFTFEQFEREITVIDGKLRSGGLLFIDHTDFRFEDTSAAANYDPVQCDANQRLRKRRLFGRDNTLLAEEYFANRIFRSGWVTRGSARMPGVASDSVIRV